MPSFDIVNAIEMMEVDNAVSQSEKELNQRFDFKGSHTKVVREQKAISIDSADENRVKAAIDVLQAKLIKRNVSIKVLKLGKIEPSAGGRAKVKIDLQEGIIQENAKDLVKRIKDSKLKVQVSIQGDLVRVTGKQRDDLQQVISFLKGLEDFPLPLQFINFREWASTFRCNHLLNPYT